MDVVTLGESMVLFTPDTEGPLRYVSGFHKTIGGAESNLAIALTRLGHQTGWISRLGNDEFGLFVRNFIRGEGVDTSNVTFDEELPTAVFFKEKPAAGDPKIYYYRKLSAASELSPDDLNEEYIKQAAFLHVTGITPALSDTCKQTVLEAIRLAKANGLKVVFDPNLRLKLWSEQEAAKTLMEIAALSDIVLPGIDEGELMTGHEQEKKIAEELLENGSDVVVVKLGSSGAYYATRREADYVEGYKVERIIDTVGAGDGFAAGFLSGQLRGWTLAESVKLGNRIGAYALTVSGDVEGYPFWHQVDTEQANKEILR
ncbi:sugar kinase [Sediminibacillus halophilus]|uniref:2-dehydro-3-deoxygluconokinase n=1 Tax=Sediminibacillus halophilus TaxID=482461 RepID=A0A1G9N7A0_9BACI|nr:sugar kinase [Sediminibacillus halophilus]SDL82432.1 2-dehydro-3-deoxygluconokinase [Sediminibacillus halophilus]